MSKKIVALFRRINRGFKAYGVWVHFKAPPMVELALTLAHVVIVCALALPLLFVFLLLVVKLLMAI